MKDLKKILFAMGVALAFNITAANAQFIVKVRPAPPVVVVERPPAPSPHHVWIEAEWKWNKHRGEYVYVPGYWEKERRGFAWEIGHWVEVPGGVRWEAGHWRRL